MRSFLIRDILSGPAANQVSQAAGEESRGLGSLADLSHHHHHNTSAVSVVGALSSSGQLNPSSSSFDSLAASQALLFKLAEHQQQFQANKYYEQLQHQHQHLLNNLTNLNGSSGSSSSSTSNHPLQLVHQSSGIGHQHHNHHNQLISNNPFIGKTSSTTSKITTNSTASDASVTIPTKTQQIHHNNNNSKSSSGTSGHVNSDTSSSNKRSQKTSSFAYDCTSPISTISDVEREDDDDDDDDDDDGATDEDNATNSNEKHHRKKSERQQVNNCRNNIKREGVELYENNDDDDVGEDQDDDDDDDEEIEVEKVGIEDDAASAARHFHQHRRSRREDYGNEQNVNGNEAAEIGTTNNRSTNQQQLLGKQFVQLNSPLDALFQMTSSTFDALKRGEKRKDRDADNQGSTNFTSKQTSKKKRKSRTAFTNNQIYELERRFRMQKYLSPTDRDEIAITLNLSNAQVITWFQNRRAKLKRDLEEQKRDIETASLLNFQKTFFESFQALSQMNTAINPSDANRRLEST